MRKICVVVAIALQLCIGVGHAQTVGPVHELRATILGDAYLFASDANSVNGIDVADRGQKDLIRLLPGAIASAAGHADLNASIKAFYISAKTYFDSALTPVPLPHFDPIRYELRPSPEEIQLKATQAKLKADVDNKANAMQLEAQLVGVDG